MKHETERLPTGAIWGARAGNRGRHKRARHSWRGFPTLIRRSFTGVKVVRGGCGAGSRVVRSGSRWLFRVGSWLAVLDVMPLGLPAYHQTRHAYVRRRVEAAYRRAQTALDLPMGSSGFCRFAGGFVRTVEREVLTHANDEEHRLYPWWMSSHRDRQALIDALMQEHEALRREVRILRAMITCGDQTGAVVLMRRIVQDFIAHTRHEEGVLMRFSAGVKEQT